MGRRMREAALVGVRQSLMLMWKLRPASIIAPVTGVGERLGLRARCTGLIHFSRLAN